MAKDQSADPNQARYNNSSQNYNNNGSSPKGGTKYIAQNGKKVLSYEDRQSIVKKRDQYKKDIKKAKKNDNVGKVNERLQKLEKLFNKHSGVVLQEKENLTATFIKTTKEWVEGYGAQAKKATKNTKSKCTEDDLFALQNANRMWFTNFALNEEEGSIEIRGSWFSENILACCGKGQFTDEHKENVKGMLNNNKLPKGKEYSVKISDDRMSMVAKIKNQSHKGRKKKKAIAR